MTRSSRHASVRRVLLTALPLCLVALASMTGISATLGAEPGNVSIEIQHSMPTDIIWAKAQPAGDQVNIQGMVRHHGPPGRNAIFGHVIAEYSGGGSQDVTRLDVPLKEITKASQSERDAEFSFNLPHKPEAPLTIRLRYVDIPFKQSGS